MGTNHMGRQSIRFPQPPVVRGFASVAGKKEREGPLGDQFTATVQDTTFGEKSWERAEHAADDAGAGAGEGRADRCGS